MTIERLIDNQEELLESYRAPLLAKIRKLNKSNEQLQDENNNLRAVLHQLGKDYGIEEIGEMLYPPKGKYIPIGRDTAYDFIETMERASDEAIRKAKGE